MHAAEAMSIRVFLASLILAVAAFFLDLTVESGFAGGMPFAVLVLATLWFPGRRCTLTIASVGTILTIVGYLLSYSDRGTWPALQQRYLAVAVIWVVAWLILRCKRAETAVLESEARFRELSEATFEGILIHEQGRILDVNQALTSMFGYQRAELIGKSRMDLIAPDCRELVRDSILRQVSVDTETPWEAVGLRKDGTTFPIEVRGKGIPYHGRMVHVAAVRDISDREAAQERIRRHHAELAHVQRFATMGEMASGIAHELNQPLTSIVNYTRGCVRRMRSGSASEEELIEAVEQAAAQAERAGEVIRRLRRFLRGRETRRSSVDVNAIIREAVAFSESEARQHGVQLRLQLAHQLPTLAADSVQIEQVLLNLIRNGIEAMSDMDLAQRELTVRSSAIGKEAVEIAVHDTGRGLSAGTADQAFAPFYTTKATGLGMGLSISRSIVEAHGGRLRVTSSPGEGTTFRFTLPTERGVKHRDV